MKKIVLLAAFGVASLVSAKNAEETKLTKEGEKKEIVKEAEADDPEGKMNCYEYTMYIPCTQAIINDTQCWGPGTGTATWEDAWICINQNGANAIDFFCN